MMLDDNSSSPVFVKISQRLTGTAWWMSVGFGMLFSCWCLCDGGRIALAVLLMAGLALTRRIPAVRKLEESAVKNIDMFPARWLAVVLCAGLLLRFFMAFCFGNYFFSGDSIVSDSKVYWDSGVAVANGEWPVSKSWATAIYIGCVVKMFGESYFALFVCNVILHCIAAFIVFKLAKALLGNVSGILFSLLFVLSPHVAAFSLSTMSENLYVPFFILGVYCACRCYLASKASGMCAWAVAFGFVAWFTCWTRGEGVILWAVFPLWIAMLKVCSHAYCSAAKILGVMLSCLIVGGYAGWMVNQRSDGSKTVFCSSDSYWPALYGANYESKGRYNRVDKPMIFARYKKDHPECDWEKDPRMLRPGMNIPFAIQGKCPPELVPYIKSEIRHRWTTMGLKRMLRHFINKESMWHDNGYKMLRFEFARNACWKLYATGLLALNIVGGFCFFLNQMRCGRCVRTDNKVLFLFSIAWVFAASAAILFVAEAAPRYLLLFHALWGIFAAAFVQDAIGARGGKNDGGMRV